MSYLPFPIPGLARPMNLATQFWRICDLSLSPIQGFPGDTTLLWAWSEISPWIMPEGRRAQFLGHIGFLLHSCAWMSCPWPAPAAPGEATSRIQLLSLIRTGVSSSVGGSAYRAPPAATDENKSTKT